VDARHRRASAEDTIAKRASAPRELARPHRQKSSVSHRPSHVRIAPGDNCSSCATIACSVPEKRVIARLGENSHTMQIRVTDVGQLRGKANTLLVYRRASQQRRQGQGPGTVTPRLRNGGPDHPNAPKQSPPHEAPTRSTPDALLWVLLLAWVLASAARYHDNAAMRPKFGASTGPPSPELPDRLLWTRMHRPFPGPG
jgi:hypothetical protein